MTSRGGDHGGGLGLLLVDVQHDFIDGSLAVDDALSIVPALKELIDTFPFDMIVASQDYHPAGHISFATSHADNEARNVRAFQLHPLPHPIAEKAARGETMTQMMWPEHCVQGTRGAEFLAEVWDACEAKRGQGTPVYVVRKGTDATVDGYSAFADNQYLGFTELPRLLARGGTNGKAIDTLVVVGLATDYCVMSSAIDARKFRLRTIVVADGVRGVAADSTLSAVREMEQWGIEYVQSVADARKAVDKK